MENKGMDCELDDKVTSRKELRFRNVNLDDCLSSECISNVTNSVLMIE